MRNNTSVLTSVKKRFTFKNKYKFIEIQLIHFQDSMLHGSSVWRLLRSGVFTAFALVFFLAAIALTVWWALLKRVFMFDVSQAEKLIWFNKIMFSAPKQFVFSTATVDYLTTVMFENSRAQVDRFHSPHQHCLCYLLTNVKLTCVSSNWVQSQLCWGKSWNLVLLCNIKVTHDTFWKYMGTKTKG